MLNVADPGAAQSGGHTQSRAVDSTGQAYDYNLVTYRDGQVVKVENRGSKVAKAVRAKLSGQ